jgi:glyoxylase-like metal-dependent hydrolase (beta-lactamase superfamily II)
VTGLPLPVAPGPWFEVAEVEPGVFRLREPHAVRLMRANLWLVRGRDRDLLVDTGMGVGDLAAALAPLVRNPLVLFTTHAHIDHIGGHRALRDAGLCAEILVHPAEARLLADPWPRWTLTYESFAPADRESLREAGFDTDGWLIDALPHPAYDPAAYVLEGVEPTRLIDEGEQVDLGDRRLAVLHLPGHSPGSMALLDEATGTLFAGDAVYDGIIVDTTPFAHVPTYLRTMRRLRGLPVRVVHGGHRESFGRDRLAAICDAYLASRGGGAR